MARHAATTGAAAVALALCAPFAACSGSTTTASSAFSFPIDFSYACEGDGVTVAPDNDESAAALDDTRMCPDLADGAEGHMFGVVLDRQPPQLLVVQMNPAAGKPKLIDADYFTPGVTGIAVGDGPLRVVRAPDWSAFYVISAGDARIDRIAIAGWDGETLSYQSTHVALPGVPAAAEMIESRLVIAARDAAELWVYDAAALTSLAGATPTVIALPDRVSEIAALSGDGLATRWLVTFRHRPTVAVLDDKGAIVSEGGLVPQCRDGLDNDGDGGIDKADADCHDGNDDDEGATSGEARAVLGPSAGAFDGAPSCDNGFDDDGDGATDWPEDLACADATDDGELRPECDDGIDQDGDGLTDLADESCYAASGKLENQLAQDGPFHPTFIDGNDFGRFVYVLDERLGEIIVFAYAEGSLVRIDVNAADADPPALESVGYGDFGDEVEEHVAIPAVRPPALRRQGVKNIQISDNNASSLSSGRLRGELWDRLVAAADGTPASVPLGLSSSQWRPSYCAPTPTDRCAQPTHDDDTWYAFGAALDGRIQLLEVIRRGTPTHRIAQRTTDPSLRVHDLTAPRLTRRGTLVNARGEPQAGLPFIGAALEEVLEERVQDETPERLRRFGVWPPADFEETPSETWAITYEGKIPSANGALGRMLDGATFGDDQAEFCEEGVEPGDWLQMIVPVEGADPRLVHTIDVVATGPDGDITCPTRAVERAIVEVPVTAVGMTTLTIDPSRARLRPDLPVLDLQALEAARLSRRACEDALDTLDETLGRPDNLAELGVTLEPSMLPAAITYAVRGHDWIAVGSRSGFLHRQRWDRAAGACVVDADLDPRLSGRITEVPDAVAKYESCPPPGEQLAEDRVGEIASEGDRYYNPSFGVDIFPACELGADGAITAVASQQDTAFTIAITGPQLGSALSISDSIAVPRVPLLDFRRQQVQLDTAAKRAAILQLRLGDPEVIVVFQ